MWDLPGPGIEPVSLALAGRFLTTAPQGGPLRGTVNTIFPDKEIETQGLPCVSDTNVISRAMYQTQVVVAESMLLTNIFHHHRN